MRAEQQEDPWEAREYMPIRQIKSNAQFLKSERRDTSKSQILKHKDCAKILKFRKNSWMS
jgi:hypothetical protein